MPPHYFSLAEANAALQIIRPLMEDVQRIREKILAHRPEIWPALTRSAGNGGNPALSRLIKEFDRLDGAVRQILATGAQIKDINTGLLDFPALRAGQEVYLCWKAGESEIAFWHEVDSGFSGRQPIDTF
jgi:hypothetical protein